MEHTGAAAPEKIDKNDKKQKRRQRYKKISAVVKLILLLIIIIGIPAYLFFFDHKFLDQFSSIEDVYNFFLQYRSQSILVYLGLQILQIVICIIPGQALQLAAGYLFHFWLGLLLSVIGAGLGTILTYYLAKVLGHDAMHMIFGEERIRSSLDKLNSKRGVIIVFLIYLIPGIPKDLCTYAAGLSEMKLKPFLLLSLTGRIPGMIGSLLIGYQLQTGGYKAAAIIGGIAVALFILGLIFHKPVMELSDKAYERFKNLL